MVTMRSGSEIELLQGSHEVIVRTTSSLSDADGERGSGGEWEIPEEAYPVLYKLAKTWTDVTGCKNLRLKPLKGAMTNQVFQCQWAPTIKGGKPRKVLVRVYGESSELFFSREDEMLTFERLSHNGQGPRLLARFRNGRVEEFLHARTLSAGDLRNPEISDGIAVKLRLFHALDVPGPAEPQIWKRLSVWAEKTLKLATLELKKEFRLNCLPQEIVELKKRIEHPGEIIGFCHNDLQYGNIMIDENDGSITLIDYEYASFNPVAFDIANHFCEMAANYHTDTPHVLDYSQYPDDNERSRFVRTYLQGSGDSLSLMLGEDCGDVNAWLAYGTAITDSEVEDLMREVDAYTGASHLHWGLWGIMSALTSNIDFNFLEYARQRFSQYQLGKNNTSETT